MINEEKVKEEFNRRASLHQDQNAVLDASNQENVKFSNIYRDYISKKVILKTLSINKDSKVIDFGCGVGRVSKEIAPIVNKIVGLDVSDKMIDVAKQINSASNIEYYTVDKKLTEILGENNDFDLMFSYWVFQHISDLKIKELMNEFNSIIKRNGSIYIFEQIQRKVAVSMDLHIMRTEQEYIELFKSCGYEYIGSKNLCRMPSYGLSLFNKIGINHSIFLWVCGLVEEFTVNRKEEFLDYHTTCLEFRKK